MCALVEPCNVCVLQAPSLVPVTFKRGTSETEVDVYMDKPAAEWKVSDHDRMTVYACWARMYLCPAHVHTHGLACLTLRLTRA